jgi:hypothetical protein
VTTQAEDTREKLTWLVVSRFEGPVDLNDDNLLNGIAELIEKAGGVAEDSIIGNLHGTAKGSLDDAFDAARGYLQAERRTS